MKSCLLVFISVFIIVSCNGNKTENSKPTEGDTPNSGEIRVAVDESFLSLLTDEVSIFEKENKKAKIVLVNLPETKGIQDFLDGKVRAVLSTRKLSDDEIKFGKQYDLNPLHYFLAFDAVALIVNNESADSVFTENEVRQLFISEALSNLSVVFNSNGSGEIQYFKDLFQMKNIPANFFATNNFSELTEYVISHNSAVGVIGINNLLSNSDSINGKVKIVAIKNRDGNNYLPIESNIRSGYYPFRREVYIVCGEPWPALGTGFAKFMTTDIGQTIIKRSGLIPARLPIRMIEIKDTF